MNDIISDPSEWYNADIEFLINMADKSIFERFYNKPNEIKIPDKTSPFTELQRVPDEDKMIDLFKRHINHESVLEHVNITFSVEGVSRSLSHQLVRHRISSYTHPKYVTIISYQGLNCS